MLQYFVNLKGCSDGNAKERRREIQSGRQCRGDRSGRAAAPSDGVREARQRLPLGRRIAFRP